MRVQRSRSRLTQCLYVIQNALERLIEIPVVRLLQDRELDWFGDGPEHKMSLPVVDRQLEERRKRLLGSAGNQ